MCVRLRSKWREQQGKKAVVLFSEFLWDGSESLLEEEEISSSISSNPDTIESIEEGSDAPEVAVQVLAEENRNFGQAEVGECSKEIGESDGGDKVVMEW